MTGRQRDTHAHDRHRLAALLALASLGCGAPQGIRAPASTSGSSSAETDVHEAESSGSQATSSENSESSGREFDFIVDVDVGPSHECSLWNQDCPVGQKCMPWANHGGGAWNATRCSPVDRDPDEVGASCTVAGNGVSGQDSCERGAMCWNVDWETQVGKCVAFCGGSETNPHCEDPQTHCNGGRVFALCLERCCPLARECPPGQACYPVHDSFACAPDASGDQGSFGDPCEFFNVCDPGLFCASSSSFARCAAGGCCSTFCDVEDPDASANCPEAWNGQACIPWFMDGDAPPGEENIGACALPW